MPPYLVVGHVTEDVTPSGSRLGGTVMFAGRTAAGLGYQVRVVTAAPPSLPLDVIHSRAAVTVVPSPCVTRFVHQWTAERRKLTILCRAARIHGHDIPPAWRPSGIWHLGPVAGEVDVDVLDVVPHDVFLGMTPQGWMRSVDGAGEVKPCAWSQVERLLPRANAIVVSDEDLEDGQATARLWAGAGAVVALTLGADGSLVFSGDREVHVPAYRVSVNDVNGAGDVYATAFFTQLAGHVDEIVAARFATAAAALAIQDDGRAPMPAVSQIERLLYRAAGG